MASYSGLTHKEASSRLREYGLNELRELNKVSALKVLLRQVKQNFIIYLLLAAMLISFFVGKNTTGFTILFIILIIITLGFIQEYRAEKAISALKEIITPVSIVIRDGKPRQINSKEIVPGDLLMLRTGEKIPADCIIISEKELRVNEAVLTGESKDIKKTAAQSQESYKDENRIFMGTFIVSGKCMAIVIHTGMNTQFGKIAGMISHAEKELPLQTKLNNIAKVLALIGASVSVITGFIILLRQLPLTYELFVDVLIVVIAMCVSSFPEALPVVLIASLASGASRMAKNNVIINRMSIIETLGETTVVCSDKTGTITKGEMTVKKIVADDRTIEVTGVGYDVRGDFMNSGHKINAAEENVISLIMKAAVACNDSRLEKNGEGYSVSGSPTEGALLVMAAKAGIFPEDMEGGRTEEISFSSERKMMSVIWDNKVVYSKGAPEIIIGKCTHLQKGSHIVKLDEKERQSLLEKNSKLTSESFRTLAFAYKNLKEGEKIEEGMVFLGIAAMEDPPRDEVKSSLLLCKNAGIAVKMITGDNKETALAIAKQIGLSGQFIDGDGLDRLTDEELTKIVKDIAVFARVRPEHKLRIVKALKQAGEIVTMTGDGVNDAPALKEAHIGIAMGMRGSDVSREAADVTLKDDNFSSIVAGVREGRTILKNIKKFVTYQLSCNFAELMILFLGILFGLPLPLLGIQILFMNIVTSDLPAIALGFNPHSFDVMERKPRKQSYILSRHLFFFLVAAGVIMTVGSLAVFVFVLNVLKADIITARTAVLLTLILLEIANAFNFRSFRYPFIRLPVSANKYLIYASIASVAATLLVFYTPLNSVFEVAALSMIYWGIAGLMSLMTILIFDIFKIINMKKKLITDYF